MILFISSTNPKNKKKKTNLVVQKIWSDMPDNSLKQKNPLATKFNAAEWVHPWATWTKFQYFHYYYHHFPLFFFLFKFSNNPLPFLFIILLFHKFGHVLLLSHPVPVPVLFSITLVRENLHQKKPRRWWSES